MNKLFSIIVPTRGRVYGLRRLLNSFHKTTTNIHALEIILVIDRDDKETIDFAFDKFPLKRIIVDKGLTMGALNMAGYRASTGRYVMLLNDDVIVQTVGWDEKIYRAFQRFPDGAVLVHVNDLCFGQELCVFPFVTRQYCELAGGICPEAYQRYKIDDHIHHVFDLMGMLGEIRVIYMADVIFEHTNFIFDGEGKRAYRLNGAINSLDGKLYEELHEQRKELALKLLARMPHHNGDIEFQRGLLDRLSAPSMSYLVQGEGSGSRVTIGMVTADSRSSYAFAAVNLLKKFTTNFDLIILDNNKSPMFNHAAEMNKIMSICKTDFLVLMDDDVFVEPGWLNGLLRAMGPNTGVVTPLHKNREGELSYAGVKMNPDKSGNHGHILEEPKAPTKIPTICSAMTLIDMRKCNELRFDESYRKYFLDIDFGLQVWEAGYEVVCSPYTTVTHLAGATLTQGSAAANVVHEIDRQAWVRSWIDSGRYAKLCGQNTAPQGAAGDLYAG